MGNDPGFSDVDDRLRRLSELGDQLEAFGRAVDFEIFHSDLDAALGYRLGPQGGRPPIDHVLMFKILVIQAANTLSYERIELMIHDRLSFIRFLGLGLLTGCRMRARSGCSEKSSPGPAPSKVFSSASTPR